jgi:hypothetical protein
LAATGVFQAITALGTTGLPKCPSQKFQGHCNEKVDNQFNQHKNYYELGRELVSTATGSDTQD